MVLVLVPGDAWTGWPVTIGAAPIGLPPFVGGGLRSGGAAAIGLPVLIGELLLVPGTALGAQGFGGVCALRGAAMMHKIARCRAAPHTTFIRRLTAFPLQDAAVVDWDGMFRHSLRKPPRGNKYRNG